MAHGSPDKEDQLELLELSCQGVRNATRPVVFLAPLSPRSARYEVFGRYVGQFVCAVILQVEAR